MQILGSLYNAANHLMPQSVSFKQDYMTLLFIVAEKNSFKGFTLSCSK